MFSILPADRKRIVLRPIIDKNNLQSLMGLGNYCSGARSLANRARSVSNITPA